MRETQILREKKMTAVEAAAMIQHGEVIGSSGFTPAGYPKVIPGEIARRAETLHAEGKEFQIDLYTGASVGDEVDGALTRANAMRKRVPYQSNRDLRKAINSGQIEFVDFHLSHVAQYIRYGFLKKPTTAIVEALDVTNDGKIYLTMSGGMSATYLEAADRIFVELNTTFSDSLKGIHDVYTPAPPPNRAPIPIYHAADRIGTPFVQVDPAKIAGIVLTDACSCNVSFKEPDKISQAIASHIVNFVELERKAGRLPSHLPIQSGVGNVANAVLSMMAQATNMDPLVMYTEVIQDSIFELLDGDMLDFASTCALTLSPEGEARFQKDLVDIRDKFIIRQQEVSNNPEIVRRLGIICMNTALEMDIFGNVNSTHVMGSSMMNGIGGSGDFCRNSYVSIFMTPSTAKGGAISAVVPMVSHVDHNEHSVQIMVTEYGLADLRGLGPVERAKRIISTCAHPDYRPQLSEYLEYGLQNAPSKHTPQVLTRAFEMHERFLETGSMKI